MPVPVEFSNISQQKKIRFGAHAIAKTSKFPFFTTQRLLFFLSRAYLFCDDNVPLLRKRVPPVHNEAKVKFESKTSFENFLSDKVQNGL